MKSFFGIKLYGKTLFFKKGDILQISLLYECNLTCSYCTLEMPTGIRPKAKKRTLDDWIKFIKEYPRPIKEVYISGGEPTMIKYLPAFVNWLLTFKGYHVTIFTNLFDPTKILRIRPSHRLQIRATYHKIDDPVRYSVAYNLLKGRYNIVSEEIGSAVFKFSEVKPFIDNEGLKDSTVVRVSPDMELYDSCYNHFVGKSTGDR